MCEKKNPKNIQLAQFLYKTHSIMSYEVASDIVDLLELFPDEEEQAPPPLDAATVNNSESAAQTATLIDC